jgi:hypothetical protein
MTGGNWFTYFGRRLTNAKEAIVEMRGRAVMIDAYVARFFGVKTKRLNEQVKRNAGRFDKELRRAPFSRSCGRRWRRSRRMRAS